MLDFRANFLIFFSCKFPVANADKILEFGDQKPKRRLNMFEVGSKALEDVDEKEETRNQLLKIIRSIEAIIEKHVN